MIPMSPDYAFDNVAYESLIDNFSNLITSEIKNKRQFREIYISVMQTILNVFNKRAKINYESIVRLTSTYQTNLTKEYIASLTLHILENFRQELAELIYSDSSYELAKKFGGIRIGYSETYDD